MPHVNVKFFATDIAPEKQARLSAEFTKVIQGIFNCPADYVSIALEPIDPDVWQEKVYQPEIVGRNQLLCKVPNY